MPTPIGQSDPTQSGMAKVYIKQGGTEEVIDVGGVSTLLGISNLNGVNQPSKVTFTISAGTTNVCNVRITVVDNGGTACAFPWDFDVMLSDNATGDGLTATTASGAVQQGVNGIVLNTYTAKKALYIQTAKTGIFDLSITDSAKTGFYVMVQCPGGFPQVSRQLVTGDFG